MIYGVDFSTAPSKSKPIVVCSGILDASVLRVTPLANFVSVSDFGDWFCALESGVVGIDAAFGLPVEFSSWAYPGLDEWSSLTAKIQQEGFSGLEAKILAFRATRESGFKEPVRLADKPHRAASPLKLLNPPMAKMFFLISGLLAKSSHDVWPVRRCQSDVKVSEIYPGAFPRKLLAGKSYKNDPKGDLDRPQRRTQILEFLEDETRKGDVGWSLRFEDQAHRDLCLRDPKADHLDAVIAAYEAVGLALGLHESSAAWHPMEGKIVTIADRLL